VINLREEGRLKPWIKNKRDIGNGVAEISGWIVTSQSGPRQRTIYESLMDKIVRKMATKLFTIKRV
jgi:hypothetical protein